MLRIGGVPSRGLAGDIRRGGHGRGSAAQGLPDYSSPEAFQVAQPTKIYSADGELLAKLYLQNREVVPSLSTHSGCRG